jgi:hypothetical protein
MNYYASGGQAHGLNSLAQELPKYGRYNDDMVAHISSDEAKLLKSLGGAGTINPITGLPEYGLGRLNPFKPDSYFAPVVQPVANVATQVLRPVEKAVVQPVSRGFADFDKQVGKTIPGGWSTVAQIAGSAMGVPTPYMVGLGALSGSGVMRPGGNFNLQGAIMGGAMAYAGSELGEYMRGAVPAEAGAKSLTEVASELADPELLSAAADVGADAAASGGGYSGYYDVPPTSISAPTAPLPTPTPSPAFGDFAGSLSDPTAGMADAATNYAEYLDVPMPSAPSVPAPSVPVEPFQVGGPGAPGYKPPTTMDLLKSGELSAAARNVGSNIYDAGASAVEGTQNFFDAATSGDTYKGVMDARLKDLSNTGSGIKNLLGAGDMTAKEAAQLAAKTAKAAGTTNPLLATGVGIYAGMGLAALDEQRKFLEASKEANQISQAAYDAAVAQIEESRKDAEAAVSGSPWNANPNRDVAIGETYYDRSSPAETIYPKTSGAVYAIGGTVDADDSTGYGPLDQGFNLGMFSEDKYSPHHFPDPRSGNNYDPRIIGETNLPAEQSTALQLGMPSLMNNSSQQLGMPGRAGTPSSYYEGFGASNMGGGMGGGAFPLEGQYGIVKMAAGGMPPRFLSGGGDGMSDSIKANINGTQEARLADGEFVIPADVVSHLGNGSSKAGAKQLYSMMDRIRSARTGRKSQGKQINPRKYMAA